MLVSVATLALQRFWRVCRPDIHRKTLRNQVKRDAQQTQKECRCSWSSDSFDRLDDGCARECLAVPTTHRSRPERWRSTWTCSYRSAEIPGRAPHSGRPHRGHQYGRVASRFVRHRTEFLRSGEDCSECRVERSSSLCAKLRKIGRASC